MQLSNVKVEQVKKNGDVLLDYGEILSKKEEIELILQSFPHTHLEDNQIQGKYDSCKFSLVVHNISYLGNPHPLFKKRIQINNRFKDIYCNNKLKSIDTLLIGIYKYKDNVLFCDFDTSTYIDRKLNNSSAHVYTIDLLKAVENGFFQKTDMNGNTITIFTEEKIMDFYKYKFSHNEIESKIEIVNTFDDFFASISKDWYGIECYQEMIEANYNNKFQSEWGGFYLEFLLNQYIEEKNISNIIRFNKQKAINKIDLDLYFPKINSFGDLKTHSESSGGILGNDLETIKKIIENGKIYYVVCNHKTTKDKDNEYVVTTFWNTVQGKDNLMSYANKMKHSIHLESFYILEINKYNFKYIDIFNQGINSDGKKRNPKISISNKNINNFIIHMVFFD